MKQMQAVIVHGAEMARAALAPGQPVTLLSAEGAGGYAGVGWWQAVVQAARADFPGTDMQDILDCGSAAGRALEALRAGQSYIVLRVPDPIWADIAERCAAQGGALLRGAPPALDLGQAGAIRKLGHWLVRKEGSLLF